MIDGLSDRFLMVDPLGYFSFLTVLHKWCIKGCCICYPVCGMGHIKEPFLLISKMSPYGSSMFPLLLSQLSFTICLTQTVKSNLLSASLNHIFPSLKPIL